MSDQPFSPDEEARLYEELGLSAENIFAEVTDEAREYLEKMLDDTTPVEEMTGPIDIEAMKVEAPKEAETNARPNPASSIVIEVPDIDNVTIDTSSVEHLDVTDPAQLAEASRTLFAKYNGAAMGLPKGSIRSNWNSLIHNRISLALGRMKVAKRATTQEGTLRGNIAAATSQKHADVAALSTHAALKVLKDTVLTEDGEIDLKALASLLKEV